MYHFANGEGENTRTVKILFILLFLIIPGPGAASLEINTRMTRVLEDGTTIIQSFDEGNRLTREEIVLRSGRHKTTYFDAEGRPQWGVVFTGTGSFGLMYYDQASAPLFKFFDHGNNDTVMDFFSVDNRKIESVRIVTSNGERRIIREESLPWGERTKFFIVSSLGGMIVGIIIGLMWGRRHYTE